MSYSAVFRSVSGGARHWPLEQVICSDPQSGDLLEVQHDMNALKDRSAAAWMKLFDDRWMSRQWPWKRCMG
ncbi:MAG: hypothetical protein R3A47_10265 [Polyangiales bacterium]